MAHRQLLHISLRHTGLRYQEALLRLLCKSINAFHRSFMHMRIYGSLDTQRRNENVTSEKNLFVLLHFHLLSRENELTRYSDFQSLEYNNFFIHTWIC